MPIYEYKCEQCGKETADLRPISERRNPGKCPKCGGKTVLKLSKTTFRFVGLGFHATDYSKDGPKI